MMRGEKGIIFPLVLLVLLLGSMLVIPSLGLANNILRSKQINLEVLKEQYARDGAAEYAMWELIHGGAVALLTEDYSEQNYTVEINGIDTALTILMRTTLGLGNVVGAEGNRVRATTAVVCDKGGGFNDDCSSLPVNQNGMVARFTISLEQVSPDVDVGLTVIYDELPKGFSFKDGTVTSADNSFTEIESITPSDIQPGGNDIRKWDLSASPVYFEQGEIKQFTFDADINKSADRYCNGVFLKMEALPNEKSNKTEANVLVGASPPEGCDGGGVEVTKVVDKLVAPPGETTTFTYTVTIQNVDQNTLQIDALKDVLPVDFTYNTGTSSGMTTDNPTPTQPAEVYPRWQLLWDGPWSISQAGQAGDTLTLVFGADITPTQSGSYYNEIFAELTCAAPITLINEGVTTAGEYCTAYSWPSGGTLVPMYDILADAGKTTGRGNVNIGATSVLESWHVENK